MVELPEGVPPYIHITQNDFCCLKQKKLKEEDISICECKFDANDAESACGERCLNVLTNTECTPGYCPSGSHCINQFHVHDGSEEKCMLPTKKQRFQKCEYVKTKLFEAGGRGWGLLADENIKAGQFLIEYCGEVISSDEAKQRSHTYEAEGVKGSYIISLDGSYFVDATRKGSLARFINHSCQPNCETRKWTVLGETRVGIFAKQDISVGTELVYDYKFEWYGGATIRCLCGAANCSIFLGAKSQGFLDYYHLWEDGDERYSVDAIPLYDSAEDEPFSEILKAATSFSEPAFNSAGENGLSVAMDGGKGSEHNFDTSFAVPIGGSLDQILTTEASEEKITSSFAKDPQRDFSQMNSAISDIPTVSTSQDFNSTKPSVKKKSQNQVPRKKSKIAGKKQLDTKDVAGLFASREAREEISKYEAIKTKAASELNSMYDEIRPSIEQHERDNQDNVPTNVAEKWIGATCLKWKAEFDFHFAVVKNVMCPPQPGDAQEKLSVDDNPNEVKFLTN